MSGKAGKGPPRGRIVINKANLQRGFTFEVSSEQDGASRGILPFARGGILCYKERQDGSREAC